MSKFIKSVYVACLTIGFIFLSLQHGFCQSQNENLLNRRINFRIEGENAYQICSMLVYQEKIPLGFEKAVGFDKDKRERNIETETGTLKEVLDSLVKQEPNYQWELRDGVINIYPTHSRDKFLQTLLETKIENFSAKKNTGRRGLRKSIYNSNEINATVNSLQIKLNIGVSYEPDDEDETADIDISNINLKGILNKIINDSGDSKLWTITRTEDGNVLLLF